ncbi:hypothetical protein ACLQ24_06855 [Micromonospora sp. DT4]|uniref:hypothetical protein n=1 Tax=Micromonospora sp. DT4 TaxID=3393438 RepID=UPI003CF54E78
MTNVVAVDCPEFGVTWVPSGVFLGEGEVPSEVRTAGVVQGWQLVHRGSVVGKSMVDRARLLRQPLNVLARMVDVPSVSELAGLDVAGAAARADEVGLPVRVPGGALAGSGGDRVLLFDAGGRPAGAGGVDFVLVFPERHLLAECISVGGPGRVLAGLPFRQALRGGPIGVSLGLAEALEKLPDWKEGPDCVVRVDSVLYDYGLRVVREDADRSIDNVAGRLEGRFQRAGIEHLKGLEQGALTAVRVDHPNRRPHLVLVERQDDDAFTVVDATVVAESGDKVLGSAVLARFTLNDYLHQRLDRDHPYGLPKQLRAPIALPLRADGGLGQANKDGVLGAETTSTTIDRTVATLVDPSGGSPGMPPSPGSSVAAPASRTAEPPPPATSLRAGPPDHVIDAILRRLDIKKGRCPDGQLLGGFLREQARRDGGWNEWWPTVAYIVYFVAEKLAGRAVPYLDSAVTRALVKNPQVAKAAEANVVFVLLLRRDEARITQLRYPRWRSIFRGNSSHLLLSKDATFFDAEMSDPVLESYILAPGGMDWALLQAYPALYNELGHNAELFHALAGTAWGQVAGTHPALREFLRAADDRRTAEDRLKIARRLRHHSGLAMVFVDHPVLNRNALWWSGLLRNTALLHDLNRAQGALRALVAPGVLEVLGAPPAYRHRKRLLSLLSKAPELANVLAEAPQLMKRFVVTGGVEALQAAVENPHLVDHLSANPHAFDDAKDLTAAFRKFSPPPSRTATRPASLGPREHRVFRKNPGLRAALESNPEQGDRNLRELLSANESLLRLLAEEPLELLPHEYRKLIAAVTNNKLVPPFPETRLLRLILAHPAIAEELTSGDVDRRLYWLKGYGKSNPAKVDAILKAMRTSPALVDSQIYNLPPLPFYNQVSSDFINCAGGDGSYERIFSGTEDEMRARLSGRAESLYLSSPDLVALTAYNPTSQYGIVELASSGPTEKLIGPEVIEGLIRHEHLLAVLAELPLLDGVGWRHWHALFSRQKLMAGLDEKLAGDDHAATVARRVLGEELIAPFLGLADPLLALDDPRLVEILSAAGDRAGLDVFGLSLTRDGIAASVDEFAIAASLAGDRNSFMGAVNEHARPEGRDALRELHTFLESAKEVRAAVVENLSLAVLAVRNPDVPVLLQGRPRVRELAVKEAITRSILADAEVVTALMTNDQFHALLVDDATVREAVESQQDLRLAFLRNPEVIRGCADPWVRMFVLRDTALGHFLRWDPVVAAAVANHEHVRKTVHGKPVLEKLVSPVPAPPEVNRVVVSSREVFRVFVEQSDDLLEMLWSRPVLVAGLNSRPGLLSEAADVRNLLKAEVLLNLIEDEQIPEVNKALFGTDEVLAFVAARPQLASALNAKPQLATLLTYKSVRTLVEEQPKVVEHLVASEPLRGVVVLSGVAEALAASDHFTRWLHGRPDLVDALKRNRQLMTRFGTRGGVGPAPVWHALFHNPRLARQLTAVGLRALDRNRHLVNALSAGESALAEREWERLLTDDATLGHLNEIARKSRSLPELAVRFRARLAEVASPRPVLAATSEPAAQLPERASAQPASGLVVHTPVAGDEGSWLNEVPALLSWLREPGGADLARVLLRSPDLLYQLRWRCDLADLVAAEPARAAEHTFGSYLDGGGREVTKFDQAVDAWAAAVDVALDAPLRSHARAVWDFTRAERVAQETRQATLVAERRARLDSVDFTTWEFSGKVRFSSLVIRDEFDTRDHADLEELAEGGVGSKRLGTLALNHARHMHLQGGNQGVSFAFVVNPQWMVDLFVYTLSDLRQDDNKYVWRGNGRGAINRSAPLDIVLGDEALTTSIRLVKDRSRLSDATPAAVRATPTLSNPLGKALHAYHHAYTLTDATATTANDNTSSTAREAARHALRGLGVAERHLSGQHDALTEDVILPPSAHTDEHHPDRLYWVGQTPPNALAGTIRAAAAGPGAPIIFLGAERGQTASTDALRDTRRLIQQFALKKQQPVVVTQATLDAPLARMSTTYGFSIAHLVPKSAIDQLDPTWRARDSDGSITELGKLTTASLTLAAKRGKPAKDSTSRAVSQLLLAPDRNAKLDILTTCRRELATQQAHNDLAKIVRQVESDPWFRKYTPLLEGLGNPDTVEFVLDYQELQDPIDRKRLLISDQGRAIELNQRVALIEDTGHPAAGAGAVMEAVNLMLNNQLPVALTNLHKRAVTLDTEEKQHWVNAIKDLAPQIQDRHNLHNLHKLAEAVLKC